MRQKRLVRQLCRTFVELNLGLDTRCAVCIRCLASVAPMPNLFSEARNMKSTASEPGLTALYMFTFCIIAFRVTTNPTHILLPKVCENALFHCCVTCIMSPKSTFRRMELNISDVQRPCLYWLVRNES